MYDSIFYDAIKIWGIPMQKALIIEEMSELTKEICKSFRGNSDNYKEILDEIADVFIVLEEAKIIFGINEEELKEHIDFKLSRIRSRLDREMDNKDGNFNTI